MEENLRATDLDAGDNAFLWQKISIGLGEGKKERAIAWGKIRSECLWQDALNFGPALLMEMRGEMEKREAWDDDGSRLGDGVKVGGHVGLAVQGKILGGGGLLVADRRLSVAGASPMT